MIIRKATIRFFLGILLLLTASSEGYAQYEGGISGSASNWKGELSPADCTPSSSNVAKGGISDGNTYDEVLYMACNFNIYTGGNSSSRTFAAGNFADCTPSAANVALGGIADGHVYDEVLYMACNFNIYTGANSGLQTFAIGAFSDCTPSIANVALGGIANGHALDTTLNSICTVIFSPCSTLVAGAGLDVSICSGDSTQLQATGGDTYAWAPTIGLNDSTIANPFAKPTVTTPYVVTVTVDTCSRKDTVTVTIKPKPSPTITGDTIICNGQSTILTASGGETYLWSTGETTTSITVLPGSTTTYWVEATDFGCTSFKEYATVTVSPFLTTTITGITTVCSGESTTLTANGGGGSPTYLWSPGGQTTSSITVSPTNPPSASYDYGVTISDTLCPSSADTIAVTVNPLPASDTDSNRTICNGASTQIGATAVGANTYSWTPVAGLDDPNISNPTATLTSSTVYTLTEIMAVTGCQNSDTISIMVIPVAVVTASTSTCSDVSLNLSASGGGASPSYVWTPGGETTQTKIALPPLPVGTPNYKVTITDALTGCVHSDSIDVTVMAAPCPVVNIAKGGIANGHALGIVNNINCNANIYYFGGVGGGEVSALGSFSDCTPTVANVAFGGIANGHSSGMVNNINCNANIYYFGGIGGGEVSALGSFADCTPSIANVALGGIANGHSLDEPALCMSIIILPIQLTSFGATATADKQVLCEWITESEINNDYFTVEKTIDTKTFSVVDTVRGGVNSNTSLYYSLIDEDPFTGFSYYRLKQTDFDGVFSYSPLLPVHIGDLQKTIVNLYPNPTTNKLTVLLSGDENIDILITITDMLGKKVYINKKVAEKGTNRFVINTSDLSGGVYFMNILNTTTTEPISLQKFIKVK